MFEPREPDRTGNVRRYRVRAADFYGRLGAEGALGKLIEACEAPIKQLIARYDLAGKSVLSIGAGEGFEEIWFARADCPLTLLDINESFGTLCASLPTAAASDQASLTYIIADAADYVAQSRECFDVLYVSSFHPDEIRREEMQRAARRWPSGQDPYHSVLMKASAMVKSGGLAIFQHYRGAVNIAVQPSYFYDVIQQFARHGLAPLEIYAFKRLPWCQLLIALKGTPDESATLARLLRTKTSLSEFHGRFAGPERAQILRVQSADTLSALERAKLISWRIKARILAHLRHFKAQITRRM